MPGGGYAFSQVPVADIPRSVFNRSHGHKTTFDSGFLIPVYCDEALPGDTFSMNASMFARLATPIFPVMDNIYLDVFFFAVPNRLLWANWQRMMGEQDDPGDSIDFQVPIVNAPEDGFAPGSLFDYMGVPTNVQNIWVSALWPRAYNLIFNEWFRDENLQDRVTIDRTDGPDDSGMYALRRRGKRHDYFTSCLPWPQKGPGVEVPLGGFATVVSDVNQPGGTGLPEFSRAGNWRGPLEIAQNEFMVRHASPNQAIVPSVLQWDVQGSTGLVADLSNATAVTINTLRQAFQIQRLLERDARGGTRYTEILRSHFGVVSPDARLQRPEYLGGGSVAVMINPVTQTSSTVANSPQGNLAAYGVAGGHGIGFTKSFVEHCTLIGLVMARADLSYWQGIPRMFSRRTRYDYYWPAFSHLGEQAVLNKEIYARGENAVNPVTQIPYDNEAFGYQERWAEYRYFPSKITGAFRSNYPGGSLDSWHLAQNFETPPALNGAFIEETPPINRVVAVDTEPEFLLDCHFNMKCVRPMPTYSVPGLIDHF